MRRQPYKSSQQRGEEAMVFIKAYFDRHFISPTYEEIGKSLGIKSRGHLAIIIDKLVEEGRLEREKDIARGLKIPGWTPPNQFNPFTIHLKGSIAANNANPLIIFDEMDVDTVIDIPPSYVPKNTKISELYALTVQGDSMEDALIGDGDTVILKQSDIWNDGDIVAVWLHDEQALTLKELYRGRSDTVKLRPRSHKHQTRVEKEGDVRVMGRVVAVLRKYTN